MNTQKTSIEKILYQEVVNNIRNYQSLVLAFSGGLDSTVLLDILYNITKNNHKVETHNNSTKLLKLRAIYIHHGLSYYADYWAYHCDVECKKRNVPFNSIRIYCHNNDRTGTENIARQLRYQCLFKNLQPEEILLTAQHLNDQSETFLLALKRGSGPKGLSGMPKRKFVCNHQLLRPLLQCSQEQIIKYAKDKNLIWITDDSNTKTCFDRNFLRLRILPQLQKKWPNINQNIARSAQLCANQEKLLDELLKDELNKLYYHDYSLLLQPLMHMSIEKRQALLRRWLFHFNIQMPSYKKLEHIWKDVILSKKDAMPIMQLNKQYSLRRFQNRLYIITTIIQTPLNNTVIYWRNITTNVLLPNKLGILIPKIFPDEIVNSLNITQQLYSNKSILLSQNAYLYKLHTTITDKILNLSLIRAPYEHEIVTIQFNYISHDKICVLGNSCRKTIKNIWKELKIPPWTRKIIPLLFYNNKLIAAIGSFITQEGYIKNTDTRLGIYWVQQPQTNNNTNIIP